MVRVKQQRIDDTTFAKMRREVLSAWPTGREVDLDEAIEYQKKEDERLTEIIDHKEILEIEKQ